MQDDALVVEFHLPGAQHSGATLGRLPLEVRRAVASVLSRQGAEEADDQLRHDRELADQAPIHPDPAPASRPGWARCEASLEDGQQCHREVVETVVHPRIEPWEDEDDGDHLFSFCRAHDKLMLRHGFIPYAPK